MVKVLIGLSALAVAAPALAAGNVSLDSRVMVEKTVKQDGVERVVLETPNKVVPGQQLTFVLGYRNVGKQAATNFVVTNPIPKEVSFAGTADASAAVSVDGGRNWGKLAELSVKDADGATRPAQAADVTHVRWTFAQAIPAGASGQLSFRGAVR